MAGAKETPRQKMIGMMYLVLTAMLALNVSSEVLNAFKIVDNSIIETNQNFEKKINETYDAFEKAKLADPVANTEWFNRATEVKKIADALVDSLINIRSQVILATEPSNPYYYIDGNVDMNLLRNVTVSELHSIDKNDAPVRFFMEQGVALKMKKMFQKFREDVASVLKPEDHASLLQKIGLNTEGPERDGKYKSKTKGKLVDWEEYYFGETILGADIIIINNFIQETRNAEFDILSRLRSYVGATDFKFNDIQARIIPDTRIVAAGDPYYATASVVAFDTLAAPEVYYKMGVKEWHPSMQATATKSQDERGISYIKFPTSSTGEHSFAGVIKVKQPDGTTKDYTFSETFYVQQKGAGSVVNDELKVLYMGHQNLISINMIGSRPENITCKVLQGSTSTPVRDNSITGRAVFRVNPTSLSDVVIVGESPDGGRTEPTTFKVKELPAPLVYIGGTTSPGAQSKSAILAAGRLDASLGPDFLLSGDQFKYTITEFEMAYPRSSGGTANQTIQGGSFNQTVRNYINAAPANTNITFYNIKVKGPDGKIRNSQNSISCIVF
ncbi:MAG: hypothetical protein LBH92_07810 [Bacteroidales bacterium]|jgi:gliding motility-associated protein GldM|nr:hypothetical protein [Bacteroidales bacterium]